MLSRCFLDLSVGVGDFVIGRSQNSSFFSIDTFYTAKCPVYVYRSKTSVKRSL